MFYQLPDIKDFYIVLKHAWFSICVRSWPRIDSAVCVVTKDWLMVGCM